MFVALRIRALQDIKKEIMKAPLTRKITEPAIASLLDGAPRRGGCHAVPTTGGIQ
jgi:hypothetical protein